MDLTADLIWMSLIVAGIALAVGWFVSLTRATNPTLGDVLAGTARSSGIPALLVIMFLWWALT